MRPNDLLKIRVIFIAVTRLGQLCRSDTKIHVSKNIFEQKMVLKAVHFKFLAIIITYI